MAFRLVASDTKKGPMSSVTSDLVERSVPLRNECHVCNGKCVPGPAAGHVPKAGAGKVAARAKPDAGKLLPLMLVARLGAGRGDMIGVSNQKKLNVCVQRLRREGAKRVREDS